MSDSDRILGAMEEFRATTHKRLDRIEVRIERLQGFKWKLIGAAAATSVIISIAAQIIKNG